MVRWYATQTTRFLILVVMVAGVAGCRATAQSGDDLARIVTKTGASRGSVTLLLDDAARASGRNSDDLARLLATAPATDTAVSRAAGRLEDVGVVDDVAKGVVCDVVSQLALNPEGVDMATLEESVYSNLIGSFGGDKVSWALTAEGIIDDIAEGETDSALWARVTLLKLQHCSPRTR